MITIKTSPSNFVELIKKVYSLDLIFILKMIEQQMDVNSLCKESVRLSALYQTLIRKELITEDGSLTTIGKDLLNFVSTETDGTKFIKKSSSEFDEDFERFWKAFPTTDTFEHKSVKFVGSRTLRVNKEECRKRFISIVQKGVYTSKQIIDALNYDVLRKKDESVRLRVNQLKYMQNCLTYLNQESFEPYIGKTPDKSTITFGAVDI